MSTTLRVLLLISALLTGGWIVFKIRRLQVKMQDAIFWVIFAVILFILGLFPQACYWLTERLGIMSPANLVFLVIIFLLLEKVFTLSIIVSQLEEKISVLSAEIALRSNAADKRLDKNEKALKENEMILKENEKVLKELTGAQNEKPQEPEENEGQL